MKILSKLGDSILLFFVFWTAIFFLPVFVGIAGIIAFVFEKIKNFRYSK